MSCQPQADSPDVERNGAGLACGDHRPDLANAVRVEAPCIGDLASADTGAERGQRQAEGLPAAFCRCDGGLVVMLSNPSSVSKLTLNFLCSLRTSIRQAAAPGRPRSAGPDRTEAKPPLRSQGDCALEHGVPGEVAAQRSARDAAITRSAMARYAFAVVGSVKSNSTLGMAVVLAGRGVGAPGARVTRSRSGW